ncbi:MAG TPA: hypothetical protein VM434_00435 [Beijerinckiaceae bacterium]|nr:hypothetical protein [Beijerinckiaceae bacterium]
MTRLKQTLALAAALAFAGPAAAQIGSGTTGAPAAGIGATGGTTGGIGTGAPTVGTPPTPGTTGSVTGAPDFTRNYDGANPQAEQPGGQGPSLVGGARDFTRPVPPTGTLDPATTGAVGGADARATRDLTGEFSGIVQEPGRIIARE